MIQAAPILVVEDDQPIQSVMCDALAMTGRAVMSADHGGIALDIIERQTVALIFLDMKMPVMDGWSFLERYRRRPGAKVPVVVLTAAQDASRRAAEVGADAYVAKPFVIDDLVRIVERYLPADAPTGQT
jgi:CheY-like chemotaxis protein